MQENKTSFEEYKQKIKAFMSDWLGVAKKKWWLYIVELAVIAIILVADLLTKKHFWAISEYRELIPGLFNLSHVQNDGGGFGLFAGKTTALVVITFIVIVGIGIYLVLSLKETEWLRISLVFIFAGGIGNNVDRIKFGYVRDFIQFAFWEDFPLFNIADSFITIGMFMLIGVLIAILVQEGKKNQKEFEAQQQGAPEVKEQAADPLDAPVSLNPMLKSENDYTFEVSEEPVKNADEQQAKEENDEK